MKFKDYYRILEVPPEASPEDIKTSYRKLARKCHPDVSKTPGSEKRFTELGEANEVLKDPDRRAAFDQMRDAGWKDGQEVDAPPAAHHRNGDAHTMDASQFSDFFRPFFEGRAGGRHADGFTFRRRGDDIMYTLQITVEEAFLGGSRDISLQTPQRDEHGRMTLSTHTLAVKIPKGLLQGSKMRLRGQGQPGSEVGLNGDLYLAIELAPHGLYRVAGRDLTLEVPIAPWEAVLGAQVAVPTLGGTVNATIPAGAHTGLKLRLKGRGLPGDPPGDQYLSLSIAVPDTVSAAAKDLYRALAKESAFNPRTKLGV